MEEGFTFQCGGVVFQMGRVSFLSGGMPHEEASVLVGSGGGFEKNCRMGRLPPMTPLPTMGDTVIQLRNY